MKKSFKWFLLSAVAVVGLTFVSCGKDDPTPPPPDGKIDPNTIATSNLIAYFPFEGNGTDQIGGLTPAKAERASFPLGRRGKAYQGTGAAGTAGVAGDLSCLFYNLPDNSKIKTLKAFTVAMWVKLQATADGGPEPMIFQLDGTTDWTWGNFFLLQRRNGAAVDTATFDNYFWKADASVWKGQRVENIHSSKFSFNTWQHYVITYDNVASKWYMYVNGTVLPLGDGYSNRYQEDGQTVLLGDLKFNLPTSLTIGAWADIAKENETWDWAGSFKGMLDEFRIYDRALTADEAKKLYQAEATQINE